jgi:nucleoside 2-deoxyribosyltransferase
MIMGKPYLVCTKEELPDIDTEIKQALTVVSNIELLDDFPKNILEIQRRALINIYRKHPEYGQDVLRRENINLYDFFSRGYEDWAFILEAMRSKNWINVNIAKPPNGLFALSSPFIIAEDGWLEIEKLIENNYSKRIFVAMWFDESMNKAYSAIEKAIKDCGMEAVGIDRKEHNNEISGKILLEIKRGKMIVADVTGQRNGVYFEAGFAMGQQKTVIWSCKEDDMKNVHFDTRQYNHVVWKDEYDLYIKIKNRLLAAIALESV